MGKRLIINGVDFSENAIDTSSIIEYRNYTLNVQSSVSGNYGTTISFTATSTRDVYRDGVFQRTEFAPLTTSSSNNTFTVNAGSVSSNVQTFAVTTTDTTTTGNITGVITVRNEGNSGTCSVTFNAVTSERYFFDISDDNIEGTVLQTPSVILTSYKQTTRNAVVSYSQVGITVTTDTISSTTTSNQDSRTWTVTFASNSIVSEEEVIIDQNEEGNSVNLYVTFNPSTFTFSRGFHYRYGGGSNPVIWFDDSRASASAQGKWVGIEIPVQISEANYSITLASGWNIRVATFDASGVGIERPDDKYTSIPNLSTFITSLNQNSTQWAVDLAKVSGEVITDAEFSAINNPETQRNYIQFDKI